MQAVILHGVVPPEADRDEQDALVEVEAVAGALRELGFSPVPLAFGLDLPASADALRRLSPRFVFNLVESVEGKGSLVHLAPALLDFLRLPYTGSPTDAMYLTSNKPLAKKILAAAGIPTPLWTLLAGEAAAVSFDGPYIVKSIWEHASIDLDDRAVIANRQSLTAALGERQGQRSGRCFVERFIDGREFNLSLIDGDAGPRVLPPAEIRFVDFPPGKPRLVGYKAKWDEDSFECRNTRRSFDFSPLDEPLLSALADLARRCWEAFDLRGYARVDFRVDDAGRPWVLEINANPCISPDGGFVAAALRAGLDFPRVVEQIVRACLD